MENSRTYTEQEIIRLATTIELNENSNDSFKWLIQNNCVEPAALCDILVYDKTSAREWLKKNNFVTLTIFLDCLEEDENDGAMHALAHGPRKEWAAVASMVNEGDDEAEAWLIKNGLKYYAAFGDILDAKIEESNTRKEAVTGNVIIAGVVVDALLGGLAGASVIGFGGGEGFEGGGALGLW